MDDDRRSTVFYHTKDKIKNVRIKVKLSKVTSSLETNSDTNNEVDEYIFTWQEKVFSPLERHLYSDKVNCTTPLQEKYHQDINRIKNRGGSFKTQRLFTYVDQDNFHGNVERLTKHGSTALSFPGKEMLAYQQLTSDSNRIRSDASHLPLPKTNLVIEEPDDEFKKSQHFASPALQSMFILADLGSLDKTLKTNPSLVVDSATGSGGGTNNDPTTTAVKSGDKNKKPEEEMVDTDEVLLCVIQLRSSNILSIKPEFSAFNSKPYRVYSTRGKLNYEFTFENVSGEMNKVDQEREIKTIREVEARHKEQHEAIIGEDFLMPADRRYTLFILGEIIRAVNFDMDSIYIHYFLDLPCGWTTNSLEQLAGTTQLCAGQEYRRNAIFNFSYPFEFELVYDNSYQTESDEEKHVRWPVLYFEICSVDGWTRYRVEGYSYIPLPATPGIHELKCHCWRPTGNSVANDLRRFFVGGTPELDDTTFTAIPCDFDGRHLAKYGFRTKSTGLIELRMHCLHQSKDFIEKNLNKKTSRSLVERIGAVKPFASVMEAIRAFKVAKGNLIKVREAFEGTLQKTGNLHRDEAVDVEE